MAALSFHLFNCDNTYNLDRVEDLINVVTEKKAEVHKEYFPLPQMSELSKKIEEQEMQYAVFVVHAHESRLSINEERAGIGYAKIYRALLRATNDRVFIVIGGDDNYKGQEEMDMNVLSQWARRKVFSQFNEENLDGSKSFIFSWDEHHNPIHEEALKFYLSPSKTGKFVPTPKPKPQPPQPAPRRDEPQPRAMEGGSVRPLPGGPGPYVGQGPGTMGQYPAVTSQSHDAYSNQSAVHPRKQAEPCPTRQVPPGSQVTSPEQYHGYKSTNEKPHNAVEKPYLKEEKRIVHDAYKEKASKDKRVVQVFSHTQHRELFCGLSDILSYAKQRLPLLDITTPTVDFDGIVSHVIKTKMDYIIIFTDRESLEAFKADDNLRRSFQGIFQCINKHVGKEAVIIVCNDHSLLEGSTASYDMQMLIKEINNDGFGRKAMDPTRLLMMSWHREPNELHKDAFLKLLSGDKEALEYLKEAKPLRNKSSSSGSGTAQGGASHEPPPTEVQNGHWLCYRSLLEYGREARVLNCHPPWFVLPDSYVIQLANVYAREPRTTWELWVGPSGEFVSLAPVKNDYNHRLRYVALMEYGIIKSIKHRDPPGYQPPEYILDDMKARHRREPRVELEVWDDCRGQLHPTVKRETTSFSFSSFVPTPIKNLFSRGK